MSNPWLQILIDLICRLYEALGGDCGDLDWDDPMGVVDDVRDAWETTGAPTNPHDLEVMEGIVAEVLVHLAQPGTLTPAETEAFQELMVDIEVAL